MAWGYIRVILFTTAFFIGMNLAHRGDRRTSSTVVIIVSPARQNKMVAVRDYTQSREKSPAPTTYMPNYGSKITNF